ncbi:hypothetical protein ACLOJK_040407 [Asimina triloba]
MKFKILGPQKLFMWWLLLLLPPPHHVYAAADESTPSSTTTNSFCLSVGIQDFYSFPHNSPHKSSNAAAAAAACTTTASSPPSSSSGVLSIEQLTGQKLKIGVPIKHGFKEFMNVESNPPKGFPIEVFNEVIKTLPYQISYEFIEFKSDADNPEYYDELLSQVYYKEFHAVVGDTAITANRSDFVDFTYEFMEAGVSLLVPTEDDDTMTPWWFLKPLTTDLWVTTLIFAVLKGILVWIFERDNNSDFQGPQLVGKILSFSVSTFVFASTAQLKSNYSRFIENLWTFLVFVLVTGYTANLTSMLTVEKLQPTVRDMQSLLKNGDNVGYQTGSFVYGRLKNLGFQESKLKNYSTVEQYAEALELGSHRGGVSAIIDEIPYLKVFPRGSPIVPDISRAVLNFTQGDKMLEIEKKWFGDQTKCADEAHATSLRLPLYSLRSIFIITAAAAAVLLLIYLVKLFYRRKHDEALRQILVGNGLWMKFLAMGQNLHRVVTSSLRRFSGFPSILESSTEFSVINGANQQAAQDCNTDDIESSRTGNIIHHHSLDMSNYKFSPTEIRVKRNYSLQYRPSKADTFHL